MRIVILILLTLIPSVFGQINFEEHFQGFPGTMVIYNEKSGSSVVFNEKRAATRFSPFSTYKIPNSIIGLETEVISDVDQVIQWEGKKYLPKEWWPRSWSRDHSLRTALKYSVFPFYRHLTLQVGDKKMKHYLATFDYGNQDISSGLDEFWVSGSLKISALEQIAFLRKFYHGKLEVSPKSLKLVKNMLVQESKESYVLSAKTGGGYLDENWTQAFGWYVGYVEKEDNVYYFAMNISGQNFTKLQKPRIEITKNVLRALGIISQKH